MPRTGQIASDMGIRYSVLSLQGSWSSGELKIMEIVWWCEKKGI